MHTREYRYEIVSGASGTTVHHTSPSKILNVEISLPPLPTQRRIAAILSSLDDKIENNRRICEKLEEMAQAIFKQWFVEEKTDAWEEKNLDEVANITMGQSPPSSTYNYEKEGLPFFQGSKEFGWRKPTVEKWCNEPKRIAEKGSILISVRAPVGDMNVAEKECCIGRGLASIHGEEVPTSVLYYAIQNSIKTIQNMSSGGSVFDSLNKKTLAEVNISVPPNQLKRNYYSIFDSIFAQINLLDDENTKLQQTRDTLLPKLMSGEIDVN
jgi:type I restriction enzyme S subunit